MRLILTLFLAFAAATTFSQITITPNSGCAGTSFQITITGIQAFPVSSQCGNITGGLYAGGGSPVLSATNFSSVSTTMTATLTIPSNFTGSIYDFSFTVPCRGTRSCADCFTVLPLPSNVTVTPGDSQQLCLGDTVYLSCQATDATSYQWKRNGNDIVGATSSTYAATFSGTYLCNAGNTCGDVASSNNSVITANQPPGVPVIVLNGAVLQTPFLASYSYQWYLNGNAIPNAFSNSYTPIQDGSYVVVVDDGNCSTASDAFIFTNINDYENEINFNVYPNPVRNNLLISENSNQGFSYKLIDVKGRQLIQGKSTKNTASINVLGLSAGIYFLVLETPRGVVNRKIRIE